MTTRPLRVGYVGNFGPPHSTENHVATALEAVGAVVVRLQENHAQTWELLQAPAGLDLDLVMWTRTWALPELPQNEALSALDAAGVPTVAYHLDRWWGLNREHQLESEPFFGCDLVVTAERGPDDGAAWAGVGVDHVWFPPAVLRSQATVGTANPKWRSPVGFVGSWAGYHDEWPWRQQLVRWLRRTYGRKLGLFPRHPAQAIRGDALADLYASIDVVVGDSCLAPYSDGQPCTGYWSDRIPETLGRGGFLLHPWVEGLEDHFTDGEHLVLVEPADTVSLSKAIDWWTDPAHAGERHRIAMAGRTHVLAHHTYERRMLDLAALLAERCLIDSARAGALTLPLER